MEEKKIHRKKPSSKASKSKKSKNKSNIVGVYIIASIILVLGVFALYQYTDVFGGNSSIINSHHGNDIDMDEFEYNGFYFVKTTGGFYATSLPDVKLSDGRDYVVGFSVKPNDVLDIPIIGSFSEFLPSNETYISADIGTIGGNEDMIKSVSNMALSLASAFYPIQGSILMNPKIVCMYDNDDACKETDVMTCSINPDKKVIELVYGSENKIEVLGNCIKMSATEGNMNRVVDRLFYEWYGII